MGAIMPLSGDLAAFGVPVQEGMRFALDEVNAAGGVNGRPLRIVFEDDRGEPRTAVNAFTKLATVDGVRLVLGPLTSGASLATAPVAERSRVVQLSTLAGTVELKHAGDFVFRLFPSSEYQAKYIAETAFAELGARRAAIVLINNAYGNASSTIVQESFREAGGEIVAVEAFPEGAVDFRSIITKLRALDPDLVFGLTYWREGAQLLKQISEDGWDVRVLGEDAWFGPVEEIAGSAVSQLLFANVAFGPEEVTDPSMVAFVERYQSQVGSLPDAYVATGYDAVRIAAEVLKTAPDSPEGIRDALYSLQYQGALGTVVFDSFGDNVGGEFGLYRLVGGVPVRLEPQSDTLAAR